VVVFSRNAATGMLRFVEALVDGVGGVDGLASTWSVAVSPDGANVYASGMLDNAVAVFRRDAETGRLSFVEAQHDGSGGVDGLGGAWLVAVSPDGTRVYAAGASDDAIAVFRREPGGALTFAEVKTDGIDGVDGLDDARGVTPSPDGAHLYATGTNDQAVAAFALAVCGNGRVEPGECCDLAAHNDAAESGCAPDCGCRGRCTDTGAECARAADCADSAGCCGNHALEADESCDDGNLDDADCCTVRCEMKCTECVPACGDAFGPHLRRLPRAKMGFRDETGDGVFERWQLRYRGALSLGPGQSLDPAIEDVRLVLVESEAGAVCPPLPRILADFRLAADQCGGDACWDSCRPARTVDHERCVLRDASETRSDPDGIRLARIVGRRNKVGAIFSGKTRASILLPRSSRVRICVRIGDDILTRVLRCTFKRAGRKLVCR
jgi:6-phosphogluconolactonase (cycloisomerase 2 family)